MDGRITALRVGFLFSSHQLAGFNFSIASSSEIIQACFHLLIFLSLVNCCLLYIGLYLNLEMEVLSSWLSLEITDMELTVRKLERCYTLLLINVRFFLFWEVLHFHGSLHENTVLPTGRTGDNLDARTQTLCPNRITFCGFW